MMNGTSMRLRRACFGEITGIEVQHDVPAERFDARQQPVEHAEIRHAAQVPHEIEADAANAAGVQPLQLAIRH
jgi:hypothetical protein